MSVGPSDQGGWKPCRPGELRELKGRLQRRRRSRLLNRALAAAAVLALVAWGGAYVSFRSRKMVEYDFGGIVCGQFRAQVQQFMAGELDPQMMEKMRQHLTRCPQCSKLVQQMQGAMSAAPPVGAPACHHLADESSAMTVLRRVLATTALVFAAMPSLAAEEATPREWFAAFAATWNEDAWLPAGSGRFSRYMRSEDDQGWQRQIRSLQGLAKAGGQAVEAALVALREGSIGERILAAQALGYLGSAAAREPLLEAARHDAEAVVRLYAVDSLGMLGGADSDLADLAGSESNGDIKRHIAYARERKQAAVDPQIVRHLAEWDDARINTASLGQPAPDFALKSLSGETIRLSQFHGKKAVVLVFIYGDT